ncbi:MAG: SDR family NAD(P)-dependent oxidoreductase [Pseudomonadota bacterium]
MAFSNALVVGSSGGIGSALAAELQRRGVAVTGLSRSEHGLDVTDEATVARLLGNLAGAFDCVFVASGALKVGGDEPEKTIKALDPAAMARQFAVNAIGPATVLKHAIPLLPRNTPAHVAVLTARVGSIGDNGLGGWYSYRAAKAAANQIVHTAAVELGRTHKQAVCVAMHPGTVATSFTRDYLGRHPAVAPEEAAGNLLDVLSSLDPSHSGRFFDYAGKPVPW